MTISWEFDTPNRYLALLVKSETWPTCAKYTFFQSMTIEWEDVGYANGEPAWPGFYEENAL